MQLVVEVDGSHHQRRQTYASRRDQILAANRYQILRPSYPDLDRDLEGIVNFIYEIAEPKQKQASDKSTTQRRRNPTAAAKRGDRRRRANELVEEARDRNFEEIEKATGSK